MGKSASKKNKMLNNKTKDGTKAEKKKSTKTKSSLQRAIERSLLSFAEECDIEEVITESLAFNLSKSASVEDEYEVSGYTDYNILDTGGEGACLFRCLAYELCRLEIPIRHQELRDMICDELQNLYNIGDLFEVLQRLHGPGIYSYIEEINKSMKAETFEESMLKYITYMRNSSSYGSELEMMVFKILFPLINLLVYREFNGNYILQPFSWENNGLYNIRIFGNGVHFQVIEDDDDKIEDETEKESILRFIAEVPSEKKKKKKKSLKKNCWNL